MNTLSEIGERIRTQDNRITSHPIFFVESWERKRWVAIQPFFTETAAQAFIAANRHNYDELRVFVASGHRNEEWCAVRDALKYGAVSPPHPREEVDRLRDLVRRFRALGLFPAGQAVDALLAEADKELNR
jgi:hypothetical protein